MLQKFTRDKILNLIKILMTKTMIDIHFYFQSKDNRVMNKK